MKQLIRRFSKIADSSQYNLLRSNSLTSTNGRETKAAKNRRASPKNGGDPRSKKVPAGHLPAYLGEEMERFVVSAEFLKQPIFLELLKRSAQEYGYKQQGVLRIPCSVLVFRQILEIFGEGSPEKLKKVFVIWGLCRLFFFTLIVLLV